MLATLRVQNYALIDTVEIDFEQGLNVLTGETGAGKSILIGALNLVLGARASGDVLRQGADKVQIDAIFLIEKPGRRLKALLRQYDIDLDGPELHLARTIGADGRSKAYINGVMTPISVLAEIGDELVDVHGQHDHQSLLKPDRQLDLLDAYGGTEAEAAAMREQVEAFRALERRIEALESDDRDRTRQMEFLRFEVNEIDEAALEPGEDEALKARINLITNAESIFETARRAYALLYEHEDGAAIDQLGASSRDLEELAAIDERFAPLSAQLAEALASVEAIASELRGYTEELEFDPEELNALNRRNAQIGALKRKYGATVEEILAYRDRAAAELDGYENRDEQLAALREEAAGLRARITAAGGKLSAARQKAAKKLAKEVTASLQDLGMKGARFEAHLQAIEMSLSGFDRAVFQLAANPGEPMQPLKQVASGGEISRIMLAIKTVLAKADTIPSLIFDEVDAGIGGDVARMVAKKMRAIAASHQVLSITHLAQIAAAGDAHFTVAKATNNGRTRTDVKPIAGDSREKEIARLLDGSVSKVSLEHARELLAGTA